MHIDRNCVRFALRLTPKGGHDAIDGWEQSPDGAVRLKARVADAPESGKANASLIAMLAKKLHIAKSRVTIVMGDASRQKMIQIEGDGAALAAELESLGDKA